MSHPYVLTMLFTSGDPDGIRVIENPNWSGRGLMFSRSDLADTTGQQIDSPGIYVLQGDDPDDEFGSQIYVGQSENVRNRLTQHQGDDAKDFWTDTIVFVSSSGALNRALISYLEGELISRAKKSKRAKVANGTQPSPPSLSAVDSAVAAGFLAEMLSILPVLGLDVFDEPTRSTSPRRQYELSSGGATALGEDRSDGFLVQRGATARKEVRDSLKPSSRRFRQQLITSGVMVADGDHYQLVEDYLFKSPSAAATILIGGHTNGRVEFKDEHGVTLKQHQIEAAERANASD
jgi:hypothetical protein